MAEIEVKIRSLGWRKIQTDCSRCSGCKEKIFSDMYVLIFLIANKVSPTKVKICQSCHDGIEWFK